jgi:hypothetical protein
MENYNQEQEKRISEAEATRNSLISWKLRTEVSNRQEEIRRIKEKDNAQGGLTGCKCVHRAYVGSKGQENIIAQNVKIAEKLQEEIDDDKPRSKVGDTYATACVQELTTQCHP